MYHNVCSLSSSVDSGRPTGYSRNDISHVGAEVDRTKDREIEEEPLLSFRELQALSTGIKRRRKARLLIALCSLLYCSLCEKKSQCQQHPLSIFFFLPAFNGDRIIFQTVVQDALEPIPGPRRAARSTSK